MWETEKHSLEPGHSTPTERLCRFSEPSVPILQDAPAEHCIPHRSITKPLDMHNCLLFLEDKPRFVKGYDANGLTCAEMAQRYGRVS